MGKDRPGRRSEGRARRLIATRPKGKGGSPDTADLLFPCPPRNGKSDRRPPPTLQVAGVTDTPFPMKRSGKTHSGTGFRKRPIKHQRGRDQCVDLLLGRSQSGMSTYAQLRTWSGCRIHWRCPVAPPSPNGWNFAVNSATGRCPRSSPCPCIEVQNAFGRTLASTAANHGSDRKGPRQSAQNAGVIFAGWGAPSKFPRRMTLSSGPRCGHSGSLASASSTTHAGEMQSHSQTICERLRISSAGTCIIRSERKLPTTTKHQTRTFPFHHPCECPDRPAGGRHSAETTSSSAGPTKALPGRRHEGAWAFLMPRPSVPSTPRPAHT